jgi:uncharacterized protein YkwD
MLYASIFAMYSESFDYLMGEIKASVVSYRLVDLTNESREENGLPRLKTNYLLTQAAMLKAKDMAAKEYFAHISPTGYGISYFLDEVDYDYLFAGENLAVRFVTSEGVTNAWLNSPTHKANIMNARFTEMGIAVVKGTYKGQETTFVAQVFGTQMPDFSKYANVSSKK